MPFINDADRSAELSFMESYKELEELARNNACYLEFTTNYDGQVKCSVYDDRWDKLPISSEYVSSDRAWIDKLKEAIIDFCNCRDEAWDQWYNNTD